jgi:hypothetical protein
MPPKRKATADEGKARAERRARRGAEAKEEEAAPVHLPVIALESDEQGLFSSLPDEMVSRIFMALANVRSTGRMVRGCKSASADVDI